MQTGSIALGSRRDASYDALGDGQRRALIAAVLTAHVAGGWALLQVREVRDAVVDIVPVFASLIAPPKPPEPEPPPPEPTLVRRVVPQRVIATAPSPMPTPFVVAAPPAAPEIAQPTTIAAAPEPVVAPPASPPAPKVIPASAVQYLEPLAPEYPRMSKRLGETGRVVVRVFIDEAGVVRDARVQQASRHVRLDEAALAAVQKARFKPYTENGRPVSGWAFIPIDFELEK